MRTLLLLLLAAFSSCVCAEGRRLCIDLEADLHTATAEVRLRAAAPLPFPVTVLVGDLTSEGLYGWAQESFGEALILLEEGIEDRHRADVLVHEWAHLMVPGSWEHGPDWGVAYAKAYRASRGLPTPIPR